MSTETYPLPAESVLNHIVDVHCHPTDAESISPESMDNLKITVCAMSSRQSDQPLVRALATAYPEKVIPCFGYHPWFSHWISLVPRISKEEHYRSLFPDGDADTLQQLLRSFPDPIPLDEVIAELRQNLEAFPNAMLGEVGLDRAFRVPYDYFASPRQLTPFVVPLNHQLAILEAQIDLAVDLRRNVSMHSVKAQMNTKDLLDTMKKKHGANWNRISVDLHSCGLSAQMWRDIEKKHNNTFLSLSTVINSRSSNHIALIKECSPDRILVESDYNDINFCTQQTFNILKVVAQTKASWGAVRRLEENWKVFKSGNHSSPESRASKEKKRHEEWLSDSDT
ncbi:Metallo-dependent hydrolase [Hymenopellis radicata]|nr:Metallo-dependent hydrolase [Hymenopellis radicata]